TSVFRLGGAAGGRFGTTGFTLGGSARGGSNFGGGLGPVPRGGGPTAGRGVGAGVAAGPPGRLGVTGDTRGDAFGTGGAGDSMSTDESGSTAAGSINPSTGSGSSSGSGSGSATGGGFGGGAVRAVGAPLGRGGSSTSRNTRLEVLRLPNLAGSSPDSGLAGAA